MLTYFLQVNVCWLLFYGAYFAFLSRETFFRLNRIWLIISLLGGLVLPLVAPLFRALQPMDTAAIMLQPFVVSTTDFGQNLQNTEGSFLRILSVIYGLGVAVSLGKLLIGFRQIHRLTQRAERFPMDDFTLLQVQEAIAPFSFFRWVFINLNLIQPTDLQQIILHEQAHVRERHSFDVVFAELLGVVFWWSPLVYFYTKSLKNVHEYAADAAVLRTSTPPQYGRLLLRQQQSGMSLSLANPFFSQLKKRILMMTRHPSKRRALVKYALAVPIFLILTLLLASPKTKVMATTETLSDNVVSTIKDFEKTHFDAYIDRAMLPNGSVIQLETGQKGGVITPEALKLNKKIVAYQIIDGKRFDTDITFLSVHRTDSQNRSIGGTFNGVTQDVLVDIFANAKEGDRLLIESVKIKDVRDGSDIFVGSMEFLVSSSPSAAFIGTPYAALSNGKRGGLLTVDEIKAAKGLVCQQMVNGKLVTKPIKNFRLLRTPEVGNTESVLNEGATFSTETQALINQAKIGDKFVFISIKLVKESNESDHIRFLRFEIPPIYAPFKNEKHTYNAKDRVRGELENTPPQYPPLFEQQQDAAVKKDSVEPALKTVDEPPTYVGGQDSMFRFWGRNIKYPKEAREKKIEGTVFIGFTVEKDGTLSSFKVLRHVPTRTDTIQHFDPATKVTSTKIVTTETISLSNEAMRVIQSMPKWTGGKDKGTPVRVAYTLPIKFKLQ